MAACLGRRCCRCLWHEVVRTRELRMGKTWRASRSFFLIPLISEKTFCYPENQTEKILWDNETYQLALTTRLNCQVRHNILSSIWSCYRIVLICRHDCMIVHRRQHGYCSRRLFQNSRQRHNKRRSELVRLLQAEISQVRCSGVSSE